MNVTLVYPCIRNSGGFNSLGSNYESLYINHGITSLSACLKQEGHNVDLLDLRGLRNWQEFIDSVRLSTTQVYCITMPTLDYHEAVQAAKLIRKLKPNALIIVGGPHPSICPEQVSSESVFNHVVVGEGEVTLPKLIMHPGDYPRIVQGERADLDLLPIEDRTVFNLNRIFHTKSPYNGKPFVPMPFLNVISGRGCVFRCAFCSPSEQMIFGKFRMRSLDHFFNEIEYLNTKYNFQTLMIDDDSFTLNPDYALKFCDLYEAKIHKTHKNFYCQSRADFIVNNPDVIERLKQVGLDTVFIGFESGSQRMLDFMQKDTTVEQNFEAAEICHKLGVKIWANFMVGLPGESKEEMQSTFDMIKKIKPEHPSGAFFTPIVGTHLYDYCKQNGLMVSEDPAVLGSRNPSVPKIKGLDYRWMRKQMYPNSTLWKRVAKKTMRTLLSAW
jgi:anaerobic magnesium-protoporphyrin IX monomethyl ester cyclase